MSGRALTEKEREEQHARKLRRINDMQMAPVKSLPMTLFMMWMSGNDIHIFSIMITGMAIYQPIQALAATGTVFAMFNGDESVKGDVWRARLVYAALCVVALVCGLGKLHFMGLLPTAAADWMDHTPPTYTSIPSMHVL